MSEWRVVREIKRGLTEKEAREMLATLENCYAEDMQHNYIESPDGPVSIGRQAPEIH